MYKNFEELAVERHECPLCDRSFETEEMNNFLRKLKSVLDRVPQSIEETENKLGIAETIHNKLIELRPHWEEKVRIEKDIPDTSSRIGQLDLERTRLLTSLDRLNEQLQNMKIKETETLECLHIADQIQKVHQELEMASVDLKEEEEKLRLLSNDGRTLSDLENHLKTLESKRFFFFFFFFWI